MFPPGTPRTFRTFDDALSASPHLRVLRAMLRVGQTTLCDKNLQQSRCNSQTSAVLEQDTSLKAPSSSMALPKKCRDLSLQPLNRMASIVQRVPSSYPCPVEDSNSNCTLFAVTDASWEALASYLGTSVSRFGQSPVIPTVCTLAHSLKGSPPKLCRSSMKLGCAGCSLSHSERRQKGIFCIFKLCGCFCLAV